MTNRPGRGGRKGQTHTATPRLRSYDVPPASEVTVTRADGSTSTVPAQRPQPSRKPARRRGPLVCAVCGYPIDKDARRRSERGKPAHLAGRCPKPERAKAAPRQSGEDEDKLWAKVTCPRCTAAPDQRCVIRADKGTTSPTPHRERVQLVHRVLAEARRRAAEQDGSR
ncbi:hypothetical protein [Streptomyces sp. NPDC020983]|uniref:zinc finger domain-containing protein n=1 Tax=Streptomyces sp. NPDC020983 TaxID=3365106 RepID=UPI0037AE91F9